MKKRAVISVLFILCSFFFPRGSSASNGKNEPSQKNPTALSIEKSLISASVVLIGKTPAGEDYLGDGIIIGKNGLVLTTYNNVRSAKELKVKLNDGQTYPVTGVVKYGLNRDFCLLKVEADSLPAITLGDSDKTRLRDDVFFLGGQAGAKGAFLKGVMFEAYDFCGIKNLIFTRKNALWPDKPGGGLVNAQGQLIGMVTLSKIPRNGQEVCFVLGINEIKPFISLKNKLSWSDFVNRPAQEEGLLMQGNVYFLKGDYKKAVSNYEKFLQNNPGSAIANANIGFAYNSLNDYQGAVPYFEKAVELDPTLKDGYYGLGKAYFSQNLYEQAVNNYRKGDLNYTYLLHDLGWAYIMQLKYPEAADIYEKYINMDLYNAAAFSNLGVAYRATGNLAKGMEYFRKAIEVNPDFSSAYYNLGHSYYISQRYPQAKINLEKAKELLTREGRDVGFIDDLLRKVP